MLNALWNAHLEAQNSYNEPYPWIQDGRRGTTYRDRDSGELVTVLGVTRDWVQLFYQGGCDSHGQAWDPFFTEVSHDAWFGELREVLEEVEPMESACQSICVNGKCMLCCTYGNQTICT